MGRHIRGWCVFLGLLAFACSSDDENGSEEPLGSGGVGTSGVGGATSGGAFVTSSGGVSAAGTANGGSSSDIALAGTAGAAAFGGSAGASADAAAGTAGISGAGISVVFSGGAAVIGSGGTTMMALGGSTTMAGASGTTRGGGGSGGTAVGGSSAGGVQNGGTSTSGGSSGTGPSRGGNGTSGSTTGIAGQGSTSRGGSGGASSGGASSGGATSGTAGLPNVAGTAGTAGSSPSEENLPEPFATAGFMELETRDYSYSATQLPSDARDYTASTAKLFYSFLPADKNARSAPVFVFFNGGPGSTTTGWLRTFGTASFTLQVDSTTPTPVQNPYSWTSLGNLLYIDARQTGFSYSTLDNPSDEASRTAELAVKNHNIYVDAGDFVRVLLRFIASQPALRNNPVVIVGESYGGMRATAMLQLLQRPQKLTTRGSWLYTDVALATEIRNHYQAVFPNEDPTAVIGAAAARQFGWQVLIQPGIAYYYQYRQTKCDPKYGLAARVAEMGLSCPPSGRDSYDWSKPTGWSDAFSTLASQTLESPDAFTQLIGVDPRDVAGLPADERDGAFRDISGSPPADLASFTSALGTLSSWDRYYLPLVHVGSGFDITGVPSAMLGFEFLENLIETKTFITRALLDSVVIADGIPDMLSQYTSNSTLPPITTVASDIAPRTGVARPCWITVTYSGNAYGVTAGTTRTIRFPTYHDSGHMVALSSPDQIHADVAAFLSDTLP